MSPRVSSDWLSQLWQSTMPTMAPATTKNAPHPTHNRRKYACSLPQTRHKPGHQQLPRMAAPHAPPAVFLLPRVHVSLVVRVAVLARALGWHRRLPGALLQHRLRYGPQCGAGTTTSQGGGVRAKVGFCGRGGRNGCGRAPEIASTDDACTPMATIIASEVKLPSSPRPWTYKPPPPRPKQTGAATAPVRLY